MISLRSRLAALAAVVLALLPALPAEAIQFASSSTTSKSVLLVPLRTGGMIYGPVGYSVGVRFAQNVGDILGPVSTATNLAEGWSALGDVDVALKYRYEIANIQLLGRFNPAVSPFLGYRYLGAFTPSASISTAGANAGAGFTNAHGLHYGVGADTELPLGFSGYAHAGMTTLMGGGWSAAQNSLSVTSSGPVDPKGMTLPLMGFGAAWQLGPVFRIAAGWDIFALPTNLRDHAPILAPGLTWINGFSIGVTLLGLSI